MAQFGYWELQDIAAVELQSKVVIYLVPPDAEVSLKFGDVLHGFGSELHLTLRYLLLKHTIDSDPKGMPKMLECDI